jgi:hypothetical protein
MTKSNNYCLIIIANVTALLLVTFGLFLFSLGKPIEAGRWVSECLTIKKNATVVHKPKIIILAGSNALFGFSAQRLNDLYGIRAVNAAVTAGLGLDYLLYYGRHLFASDRIIVLPLEYEYYGEQPLATSSTVYQVSGYDPQFFWGLSPSDKLKFLTEITPTDRFHLLKNAVYPYPKVVTGYQSRTLNAYGDETVNSVKTPMIGFETSKEIRPHTALRHNDKAWNSLKRFVLDANKAGVTVFLAYPNVYYKALDWDRNAEFFREITARAALINARIIGTPLDSAFKDEYRFDSDLHQNIQGQIRSTDRLFKDLRAVGAV